MDVWKCRICGNFSSQRDECGCSEKKRAEEQKELKKVKSENIKLKQQLKEKR